MTEIMSPLSPPLNCSITWNCNGKGVFLLQRPNVTQVFIPRRLDSPMKPEWTTRNQERTRPLCLPLSLKGPVSPCCVFAMCLPVMILIGLGVPCYITSISRGQCLDGRHFFEKNVKRKYWWHVDIVSAVLGMTGLMRWGWLWCGDVMGKT